jgi:hypothetical protein
MGSVGLGNTATLGAFLNRTFPEGLDLGRCQITQALGVYVADPLYTFSAGMAVMRNASGLVVKSDGHDFLGVAKWNHALTCKAAAVDEPVVLTGTTTTALAHGNVSNIKLALTAGGAPVAGNAGSNWQTISATNGTIARVDTIVSGNTFYLSYTYELSETQLLTQQGKNFWNSMDEVSENEGRVTVITEAQMLFTTQYDSSQQYSVTGALSNLFCSDSLPGYFTSNASDDAGRCFCGRVFQIPTATDPFLGFRLLAPVYKYA